MQLIENDDYVIAPKSRGSKKPVVEVKSGNSSNGGGSTKGPRRRIKEFNIQPTRARCGVGIYYERRVLLRFFEDILFVDNIFY